MEGLWVGCRIGGFIDLRRCCGQESPNYTAETLGRGGPRAWCPMVEDADSATLRAPEARNELAQGVSPGSGVRKI